MASKGFSYPSLMPPAEVGLDGFRRMISAVLRYIEGFINSYVARYDVDDGYSFPIKRDLVLSEVSSSPGLAELNGARLYVKDNGSGKTQLVIIYQTGSEHVLDTET